MELLSRLSVAVFNRGREAALGVQRILVIGP